MCDAGSIYTDGMHAGRKEEIFSLSNVQVVSSHRPSGEEDLFKVGNERRERKTISARLNCQVGPIDDCEPKNLLLLARTRKKNLH